MRTRLGAGSQPGRRSWLHRHGQVFSGRAEDTEAHILEALRLSPRDVYAYRWMLYVGIAKAQLGADAEAVVWLRRSIEANRNYPLAHFHLAETLALLGQLDEARVAAQAGLALQPDFTLRRYRENALSDNPAYLAGRKRSGEGMRLAGVRRRVKLRAIADGRSVANRTKKLKRGT